MAVARGAAAPVVAAAVPLADALVEPEAALDAEPDAADMAELGLALVLMLVCKFASVYEEQYVD